MKTREKMTIRITKSMAIDASKKMADKAYEEKIGEIKKEINKKVEEVVRKYIPAPVIACVNEYGDYFYSYRSASIAMRDARGYRSDYVNGNLTFNIPSNCHTLIVEKKDYEPLRELQNKADKLIYERNDFEDKIYNALISLNTLKKVQEQLPEAVKYIDLPSSAMALAPVYTELNNLIGAIK